jgi:hypothetical protein
VGSNPTSRTTVRPFAVVWELRKLGKKESTLVAFSRKLRYLEKHVDLNQPENVKEFIVNLQCSDGHKDNLIDVYYHYAKFNGLRWSKPHYFREESYQSAKGRKTSKRLSRILS